MKTFKKFVNESSDMEDFIKKLKKQSSDKNDKLKSILKSYNTKDDSSKTDSTYDPYSPTPRVKGE